MFTENLIGKKIVLTAGRLREDIDGVRHYANHKRPESQGYAVATKLAALGADVTVIGPKNAFVPPKGCRVIQKLADGSDLVSGRDLMEAMDSHLDQNTCDAVLCLAALSGIRPATRSPNKLKIKNGINEAVSLSVIGNIDVEARAKARGVPVVGYNSWQEFFSTANLPAWLSALASDIHETQDAAYPAANLGAQEEAPFSDAPNNLKDKRVIITSGPTVETITATGDVITNFSSGRQGGELARAFAYAAAKVVFVTGPTSLPPPVHANIEVIQTTSARSMLVACETHLPADVFVGVAAVADFGSDFPFQVRLKENQSYDLVLDQNPDILSAMGHHPEERPDVVAGFAAETDPDLILEYAKEKLAKKNADLICANIVGPAQAHGHDENRIIILTRGAGPRPLSVMSKTKAAQAIVREVAAHFPSV